MAPRQSFEDRIAAIVAAEEARAGEPSELYLTAVHASAALRRRHDALEAIRAAKAAEEGSAAQAEAMLRGSGEAAQAAICLYLAAASAQRFCTTHGREPGPLGLQRLAHLVHTTKLFRDAVMHWDEKTTRDPRTFIALTEMDMVVLAPPPKHQDKGSSVATAITWAAFEMSATRLYRWAAFKLHLGPR